MIPSIVGRPRHTGVMIGMDTKGVIQNVVLDYNSEPYGYFSVDPPEFADQFKGKSIRAPFRVGEDIHAVSRATLTSAGWTTMPTKRW